MVGHRVCHVAVDGGFAGQESGDPGAAAERGRLVIGPFRGDLGRGELELELIQPHMAQKPVLRGEVGRSPKTRLFSGFSTEVSSVKSPDAGVSPGKLKAY